GQLSLYAVKVGGEVNLDGLQLTASDGRLALTMGAAEVKHDVSLESLGDGGTSELLRDDNGDPAASFSATGGIELTDLHVGGNLILSGSSVRVPSGEAGVRAERLSVDGDLRLGRLRNYRDQTEARNPKTGAAAPAFTFDTHVVLTA